jgi:hypothetical protein
VIKVAAVVALLVDATREELSSVTRKALVPYYAAVTFHVLSGDGRADAGPALLCGILAGLIA